MSNRFIQYRHRGQSVPVEHFPSSLWIDVLVQYAILEVSSGRLCGVATCYGVDWRNQTGKLALLSVVEEDGLAASRATSGMMMFIDFVFGVHPLRKLYLEVLEWNLPQFGSIERWGAAKEAHFVDHELHGDTGVDLLVYSVSRDNWRDFSSRRQRVAPILESVLGSSVEGARVVGDLDSLDRAVLVEELKAQRCEIDHGELAAMPIEDVESLMTHAGDLRS